MASESSNSPSASTPPAAESSEQRVPAGRLPPWTVGNLPPSPRAVGELGFDWWGPACSWPVPASAPANGSSVRPSAPEYGGTLLWLAALSIIGQVFCNLEMMRYAVYCGESIIVGYLRTWPGPRFWMIWYAVLDLAAIWPFNASNAAVPLAAAMLGHLPGRGSVSIVGLTMPEWQVVKVLGYVIFLAAFVPLIFGGTIYKMLERVMAIKLVLVLGYLVFFAVFMVSASNAWEVFSGFFRFGTVPLRAETIVVGRHFTLTRHDDPLILSIKGTIERAAPLVTTYAVDRTGEDVPRAKTYRNLDDVPARLRGPFQQLTAEAVALAQPNRFTIVDEQDDRQISVVGRIDDSQAWHAERFTITPVGGNTQDYSKLSAVPEPFRDRFQELLEHQGLRLVGLFGYLHKHGRCRRWIGPCWRPLPRLPAPAD